LGQIRGLKKPWAGEEENKNAWAGRAGCVWVHPQNSLNGLILNWCTGGCWFTPAQDSNFLMENFDGHSEPKPTSAASTGCLLLLSCE
jgi:hypothetical protein